MLEQDLNIQCSSSFLFCHGEEGNSGTCAVGRGGNNADLKAP